MKFLFLNTDYADFLPWLYASHPGLEDRPYGEQLRARYDSLFGVADFYSSNLQTLGFEAHDLYANNECLQNAWIREHGSAVTASTRPLPRFQRVQQRLRGMAAHPPLSYLKPLLMPMLGPPDQRQPSWFYETLARQIQHYKPDVLVNQDMSGISSAFLGEMKPYVRLLVGQHAATRLNVDPGFACYDLTISSFPPTLEYFRKNGLSAELNRLGFESKVLSRLTTGAMSYDVTLIGSFHNVHSSRVAFMEDLCARLANPERLKIWAPTIDHLPVRSRIRQHYMGRAWGCQMYDILNRSKMTLNHHGDVPPYANNMRLYEATGVGTLLVTDWKVNLQDIFTPGKEVLAYRTPAECAELIQHYLGHDAEREAVARAGKKRTLHEHTFFHRMQELADVVRKYL